MSDNTAVARRDTEPGTAVAKKPDHPVIALLKEPLSLQMIQPMLPKGTSIKHILAEVFFAVRDNPDIGKCTPTSIVKAVATCARWDLVIGETCHLVPYDVKVSKANEPARYEKRLVAQKDYRGKIEHAKRSGAARAITAHVVYEGDTFIPRLGTETRIEHIPAFQSKKITHAYAVAHHGQLVPPTVAIMTFEEIEQLRKQSKLWNPEKIRTLPPWWAKKAVVHAVTKLLPTKRGHTGPEDDDIDDTADAEFEEIQGWTPADPDTQRLNPAYPGRALADTGGDPFAEGHAPRGLGVETRTITRDDDRPDPALLARYQEGPDEYGLADDDLPPVDEAYRATPPAAEQQRRDEDAAPACPECGGAVWDNRTSKRNANAPDYKCKDRDCNGAIWLTPKRRR